MIGIAIHNENRNDKPIGISFRRISYLERKWSVFEVSQSKFRFNALDRLVGMMHSVRVPIGFSGNGIKTKGKSLAVMAHLKYRGGESRKGLFSPRFNNSDIKINERSKL